MELKFIAIKESLVKDVLKENGVSRTLGRKIKLYGKIYVNEMEVKNHLLVKPGDEIKVILPPKINKNIYKSENELDVLYEDEWILIVNKEPDLSIQPSKKHSKDNLVSRVLGYFSSKNESSNCHVLTRLDYATSGIVVIAKNAYVHNLLSQGEITKKYVAEIDGKLDKELGKIRLPIARDSSSFIKRKVDESGKDAITLYKYLKGNNGSSLYELTLVTGRTHQIRVHLSHLGFPIIGDKLYGGIPADRLHLHACYISFSHPITSKRVDISSDIKW